MKKKSDGDEGRDGRIITSSVTSPIDGRRRLFVSSSSARKDVGRSRFIILRIRLLLRWIGQKNKKKMEIRFRILRLSPLPAEDGPIVAVVIGSRI